MFDGEALSIEALETFFSKFSMVFLWERERREKEDQFGFGKLYELGLV